MSNAGWRAPQPPTPHPSGERPWPFGRRGLLLLSSVGNPHWLNGTPSLARASGPARRKRSDNAIVISLDAPHDQIVAVHHLAPPGKSEDRKDIHRGAAF